jgi:heme-degrading monooxygenase HmoA
MVWVSLTRLRVRSVRFLPGFAWFAFRSNVQAKRAAGNLAVDLLADRERTFWTMTVWESRLAMLAFMTSGPHKRAMPKLLEWCDEASVAHWEQEGSALVGWDEADRRMRATGRASKVLHPSAAHAGLGYRSPRVRGRG